MSDIILLNIESIRQYLPNTAPHQALPIEIYSELTSTIDQIKNQLQKPDALFPHIILAEKQTQARGQLQKKWYAPAAENIYLSSAWVFHKELHELAGLSLVVGLAIAKALELYGIKEGLKIKWPNDIYYQNKKLAGILIETEARNTEMLYAIISLGCNVNMTAAADQYITQPWISLNKIFGKDQDRNVIVAHILQQLLIYLPLFLQHGWQYFLPQWHQYDFLHGKTITLKNSQGEHVGIVMGVDLRGHLLLQAGNGEIFAHVSGEIIKNF